MTTLPTGAHVRFVARPDVAGVIVGRNRFGFSGPWQYEVDVDGQRYIAVAEHLERAVVRIPFRPRVVGGTDYQDTLPCEVEG